MARKKSTGPEDVESLCCCCTVLRQSSEHGAMAIPLELWYERRLSSWCNALWRTPRFAAGALLILGQLETNIAALERVPPFERRE